MSTASPVDYNRRDDRLYFLKLMGDQVMEMPVSEMGRRPVTAAGTARGMIPNLLTLMLGNVDLQLVP